MSLGAVLKVLNGNGMSGMVGPGVGARRYDKQLLMSVDDREGCRPSALKPCSVSGENLCQVKLPMNTEEDNKPEWPDSRRWQRFWCNSWVPESLLIDFLAWFGASSHKTVGYCSPHSVCSDCSRAIWAEAYFELSGWAVFCCVALLGCDTRGFYLLPFVWVLFTLWNAWKRCCSWSSTCCFFSYVVIMGLAVNWSRGVNSSTATEVSSLWK